MKFLFTSVTGCLVLLLHCKSIEREPQEKRKLIEMEVKNVMVDRSGNPVIILEDKDGARRLPIWIGIAEARAIAMELEKIQTPRPMTHDLLKNILDTLGMTVVKIVISELKGSTFYAEIHLKGRLGRYTIDSRPSDAIALSLRTRSPIFVVEDVIKKSEGSAEEEGGRILYSRKLGAFLQEIEALVAEALELKGGVAVAEVEPEGEGARIGLKPGDVILKVNSRECLSVKDVEEILESEEVVSITVLRGKERVELKKK